MRECSAGHSSAKRLWSHTVDHGAAARMNPASRKYAAKTRRLNVRISASGLHARKMIDARGHVAILAGVGLQLEEDRERACRFAGALQGSAEIVEQLAPFGGGG